MPTLYVLSGPEVGRRFVLADGAVIGRADGCDAVLRHLSISRRHARLERKRAGWRIVDLASRNGLFEGEERVKHLFLDDGAEFRLGELDLRVRFEDEPADGATAGAADDAALGLAETVQQPRPDGIAASGAASEEDDDDLAFADDTPVAAPAPRGGTATPQGSEDADDGGIALEEPDEISLEGPDEIDLGAAPARSASDSAPPAPSAPARPAPRAASRSSAAERAGIAPAARTGSRDSGAQDPARKALQYHRVEARGGFLSADLAQYPTWVRLVALLLGLVLFAGLFVLAFRAASS